MGAASTEWRANARHAHDGSDADIQAAVTRVVENLATIHAEMMRAFDGALAGIARATRCLSDARKPSQARKVRLNRLRRALTRRALRLVLGRARDSGMPGFGKLRIVGAHDKVLVTVASIDAAEAWLREWDLRHSSIT